MQKVNLCKEVLENAIGVYKTCDECLEEGLSPLEAVSVQAMEELLKYRAIGTVEEFKVLKEKSVAKKPVAKGVMGFAGEEEYHCPNCNQKLMY